MSFFVILKKKRSINIGKKEEPLNELISLKIRLSIQKTRIYGIFS